MRLRDTTCAPDRGTGAESEPAAPRETAFSIFGSLLKSALNPPPGTAAATAALPVMSMPFARSVDGRSADERGSGALRSGFTVRRGLASSLREAQRDVRRAVWDNRPPFPRRRQDGRRNPFFFSRFFSSFPCLRRCPGVCPHTAEIPPRQPAAAEFFACVKIQTLRTAFFSWKAPLPPERSALPEQRRSGAGMDGAAILHPRRGILLRAGSCACRICRSPSAGERHRVCTSRPPCHARLQTVMPLPRSFSSFGEMPKCCR